MPFWNVYGVCRKSFDKNVFFDTCNDESFCDVQSLITHNFKTFVMTFQQSLMSSSRPVHITIEINIKHTMSINTNIGIVINWNR